ncbi:MAG: HAMP domain-containing sensor histidine kinase [Pseudomonadota bacterium]|nr:HAMP domain-containing sensor histidine kinase [Pseudomonadota bacterium]
MPADKLDISTFLVSSIHDMKNSLGMMAAYLEDALAEPGSAPDPVDTQARRKTAQALYEVQRVNNHLVQLLALYKIDQAFYPFDPQGRPLADLAREALARAQPLADSKGIALDCECPEDLYGWIDYELVFGVVVQALHNALHYAKGRVLLSAAAQGSGMLIRVEDDGPGFPDFLLEQGNAAQRGISFETGCTGLGLYFADVVARLHKAGENTGCIRLENGGQLGGGCFSLELP